MNVNDIKNSDGVYIVIVEYSPDDIKHYYFYDLEEAKEVNNHAKQNGLISDVVDHQGNILVFKDC